MTDSIWDEFMPPAVVRDGYKRPLIVPPEGGDPIPYTRVSTFAGYLDNGKGLAKWQNRNIALGIARHDDLRRMVAALAYGDADLDEHIETALCRMDDKAAWGTAVHSFTEPDPSPFIPEEMAADVQSYADVTAALALTPVHTELFVVNDTLKVAGTLDHVYDCPRYGRPVADKKTGKKKAQSVAIQLACYGGSVIYDPTTNVRTPLDANPDTGLLVHIPKQEGRTEVFPVDLEKGRQAARLALAVQEFNRATDLLGAALTPVERVDYVVLAQQADSVEALLDLFNQANAEGRFDHMTKAAFTIRKQQLAGQVAA